MQVSHKKWNLCCITFPKKVTADAERLHMRDTVGESKMDVQPF